MSVVNKRCDVTIAQIFLAARMLSILHQEAPVPAG